MVWNPSRCFLLLTLLAVSVHIYATDSSRVNISNVVVNDYSDEDLESISENKPVAKPDGKQINRAELDRKAQKLNFDEKKKKEEEKQEDSPQKELAEFGTFNPGDAVKTIAFIAALALLLAVLIYLILKTGKTTASAQQRSASAAEWEEAWNLNVGEALSFYDKAIQEGNYRLAIRLSYLKNLRRLIDRKLVNPSPEKTNRQYARELEGASLAELFRETTRIYETVWYGEANPDQSSFGKAIIGFNELYERAGKG